jgi:hypothetical protein
MITSDNLITVTKLFECGSALVAARSARDILDEIGQVVLNRNSDNLFAETEQVTVCTPHGVPGIEAPLSATSVELAAIDIVMPPPTLGQTPSASPSSGNSVGVFA